MQFKEVVGKSLVFYVLFSNFLVHGSNSAENDQPVMPPKSPVLPNCGNSFPGTPKWNACWATFQNHMNNFQQQMQEYGQQISALSAKNEASNGNYYSQSQSAFSSSMGSSHSSVMTNGYMIEASGIPISTSTQNNQILIKLAIGNFDDFESKTEGTEIEMKMKSGGQQKWAKVRVPEGVNLADVKVERSLDTILISGPLKQNVERNLMPMSSIHRSSGSPESMSRSMFMPRFPQFPQFPTFPADTFNPFPQMWVF